MKTILFEQINLSVDDSTYSMMEIIGHGGELCVELSPREIDVLIAELTNHRAVVEEKIEEQKNKRRLERERKKQWRKS